MTFLKSKKVALAISLIFSIAIIAASMTFAQGYGRRGGGGPGYAQQGPVLRTEMFNARITILAEMADESQDDIKAKLRYKPMWSVMDEYKIDYTAFNKKMIAKRAEIIKKAVADGKISQDRADFMLQRNADDFGPGMNQGKRGRRGGWGNGPANCPRY